MFYSTTIPVLPSMKNHNPTKYWTQKFALNDTKLYVNYVCDNDILLSEFDSKNIPRT